MLAVASLLATAQTYEMIVGYTPGSAVTDHNALDLDQAAIESALGNTPPDYTTATLYYGSGGHSKGYVTFTVPALSAAIASNTAVTQGSLTGKVKSAAAVGATSLDVLYSTTLVQATYVSCSRTLTAASGCFTATGALTVGSTAITPTAVSAIKFGRKLKGFSTGAQSKMYTCYPGMQATTSYAFCPYRTYTKFYNYYGDFDYADKWVTAALTGTKADFSLNGDQDFTGAVDETRVEAIKKGTAYMNVWMYVIREFEDAIDDCVRACVTCNADAVHAWDEGVAFYAGSREGTDGAGSGKMVYNLADKRAGNYKTCGVNADSTSGTSKVNIELLKLFIAGKALLNVGGASNCALVRPIVDKIIKKMTVPLIQGTLRYAYKVSMLHTSSTSASKVAKEKAEGAVFAASVLPMVHACSPTHATTIYNHMKIGAATTTFATVLTAFQSCYSAMGVTCVDIGGLWNSGANAYYTGFSPCDEGAQYGYSVISGFQTTTKVTDHNAIDQDQKMIEAELGESPVDFTTAKSYYENGAGSKGYVTFTVPALSAAIPASTAVTQGSVSGKTKSAAAVGATSLDVLYSVSITQATYVSCNAAGIATACFSATGALTVASTTITPTAVSAIMFGRDIKGFSTGASSKMLTCNARSEASYAGCPYKDFDMFYKYYGNADYADKWVTAALTGTKADFATNGDQDFTGAVDETRVEAIKKGTAYMNVWMYVVREFEDAIDDCVKACATCNVDSVHAWDEGVAFYSGMLEGTDGSGSGKLVYNLADKRAGNYKTGCGTATGSACTSGTSTSGTSYVNTQLLLEFNKGKRQLLLDNCAAVRPIVDRIIDLMTIPLIQGTLRYAYKVAKLHTSTTSASKVAKEKAEGAVFAASVLPRLHHCRAASATTVYNHMKIGAATTTFEDVRTAFELAYSCLNVTCADIGGLWNSGAGAYYAGWSPCDTTLSPPSPPMAPPPPSPSTPAPSAPATSTAAPCFDAETAACRLASPTVPPRAAHAACYEAADAAAAALVPMGSLAAGDVVLAADAANALTAQRVLVNQHRAAPLSSPVLTLHHAAGGALTLTPDHVLLVDGAFQPAAAAKPGATLTLADGAAVAVERVVAGRAAAVVNPVTVSGTILAGEVPVVAATYPEWSAAFMLAAPAPLPFPLFHALAYAAPATTQSYYDAVLEPAFNALLPTFMAIGRTLPPAATAGVVLLGDALVAAGLLLAPLAAAAAVRRAMRAKKAA